MSIWESLKYFSGGGGDIVSVNGKTGAVIINKGDVGLSNVDNTSDAFKPISNATQLALDAKQNSLGGNNNQLFYKNNIGVIEPISSFYMNPDSLGIELNANQEPSDETVFVGINNFNSLITPTEDSSNANFILHNNNITKDSEFDISPNSRLATFISNFFSVSEESEVGEIVFLSNNFNIGDSDDETAVVVNGISYSYGFGTVFANARIEGAIQGYGFQPNFEPGSTVDNVNQYVSAFYDSLNAPDTSFGFYTSYQSSPNLGSIANNKNYSGLNINPTIPEFLGNAGVTGIFVGGNLGQFDTGNYNGVLVNPNIDQVGYAVGVLIDMSNVTADVKQALYTNGDVQINGSLGFTGGFSIGQLNAFFSTNPIDGGGNPGTIHSLISQITALEDSIVENADTIGVNTAMLITLEENSVITSGAFGLGFTALALPCVVLTNTGASLDFMSGTTTAINLDPTSTGGTIDTIKVNRSVAIPNGITTVNKLRGFQFDLPFGDPGTVTHGFFTSENVHNYFAKNIVVGELAEVSTNDSVGIEISSNTKSFMNARMTTLQRDNLTISNGMQIYNTDTHKFQGVSNGTWVDLH